MWRFRKFPLAVPRTLDTLREAFANFRAAQPAKSSLIALFVEYTARDALVFATPGASAFASAADGWRRSPPPLWSPQLALLAGDAAAWDAVPWDPPGLPVEVTER